VIGRDLIQPSMQRETAYDSVKADASSARKLTFACSRCGTLIVLDPTMLAQSAWDYERELGDELAAAARSHFGIGAVGKAHDGGFAGLRQEQCPVCKGRFLVYVGVREPANGRVQLTLQGVAELEPAPPAV
jgi:hypothetical protein